MVWLAEMVVISPYLLQKHLSNSYLLQKVSKVLEDDDEVNELLKMSNVMAVTRLKYNDHGIVHARIVAGASLELMDLLLRRGVEPTTLRDGITRSVDEVKLIVLLAAYLHDIGNSVHRVNHEYVGALLAKDILDRVLRNVLEVPVRRFYSIRQEVLHAIYATEYHVECLTVECSVVKIGDGLDMSEGRARIPYKLGKMDMHSVSALSIKKVEVEEGSKPIKVMVYMDDMAGLFQLEQVLMPKLMTSTIRDQIEVHVVTPVKSVTYYPRE